MWRKQASLQSQVENLQKQLDEVIAKQDDVNSKLKYVLEMLYFWGAGRFLAKTASCVYA